MRRILTIFVFLLLARLVSLEGQTPTAPWQVYVFDRQGVILQTLGPPGVPGVLSLSPDKTRVAIARSGDIWTFDIATGASKRITSTPTEERQPIWSPDSEHLAYESQRAGIDGLYRRLSDGTGEEELLYTIGPEVMNLTGWSPDGRFLVYYGGRNTDLWVLSLTDRKATELTRTLPAEVGPRISPDGRFVAYRSNESGVNEVYVQQFDIASGTPTLNQSAKWQISKGGSVGMVRWRDDGREIYYLAPDGGVMVVDVKAIPSFASGNPRLLFRMPRNFPLAGQPGRYGDAASDGTQFGFMVPVGN